MDTKAYADGFRDGCEEAMFQLVGRSTITLTEGPPQEHVTPEVRAWAEAVLARIATEKAGA